MLTWDAHCTCWDRAQNSHLKSVGHMCISSAGYVHVICTSIHAFKATRKTFGHTGFKLGRSLAAMDGNMPLF